MDVHHFVRRPSCLGYLHRQVNRLPVFPLQTHVSATGFVMTREVDNQLKVFQDLNTTMMVTGEFTQAGKSGGSKQDLLKMVHNASSCATRT